MKKNNRIWIYFLLGFIFIFNNGCRKENDTHTVTDVDDNVYKTITIGSQTWMAENLKATHYRNGVPIANVNDSATWVNLTTGAYCNYNNNASNAITYGCLYNWYAVNDIQNIAPSGWHVPSDAEWTTMTTFLKGDTVAGGKLKGTGTTYWQSPNTGASNSTGFNALPGGCRSTNGLFYYFGSQCTFWSSTEINSYNAWFRGITYNHNDIYRINLIKSSGFSVRCVKDN